MDLNRELDNFTDDEDFNELVNLYVHPRRQRQFRVRENHFQKWNDDEFHSRFRLSKGTVRMLIDEISPQLQVPTNR